MCSDTHMLTPVEQPKRIFLGRTRELAALLEAWETAQEHPTVVLLHGPTGRGKTALVQELYARVAAEQPERYWPPEIGTGLVPQERALDGTPPPWLWLAARCSEPGAATSIRPQEMLRAQMREHLAGVYAGIARRDRRNTAARAVLTMMASISFPGAGSTVALGTRIAQSLDEVADPIEATRDLVDWARKQRAPAVPADPEAAAKAFEDEFAGALQCLVDNLQAADGRRLPIVLVMDDVQWADAATIGVCDTVVQRAKDEQWPFLMIVVTWSEALAGGELVPFVRALEEREAMGPGLAFTRVAVEPLAGDHQRNLIRHRIPTFPEDDHDILLERSAGDLDLLEDYCTELDGRPYYRDHRDRISVPRDRLRNLPATKAEMARETLLTAGRELSELLAMGAAQGWKFYAASTAAMAQCRGKDRATVDEMFGKADHPYRICAVALHDVLGRAAEFRAYPYYEESRKTFEQLPFRRAALQALADTLREQYERDRFTSLNAVDRVELLEDLVEVGRQLDLRYQPEWDACLNDCMVELAASQLCLGHPDQAEGTAQEVLDEARVDSENGQRALAILCEAAHIKGSNEAEDRLLDQWSTVPEERRADEAFVRRARRDIRAGRGDDAVETLDRLLARGNHARVDRLVLELERARALCYSGDAALAPDAVRAVEVDTARAPIDDPDFRVRLEHTAYIAAHNLEHNDDATQRAEACMELYEAAGVRGEYLMSKINLGDAQWGGGHRWLAERTLKAVRAETADSAFSHPRALAALCLANVLALDAPARAAELYAAGIADAQWEYDRIYGRIYQALLEAEQGDGDGTRLRELSREATSHCLSYLADVAAGYGAMRDAEARRPLRGADELLQRRGAVPLARAYAAAAALRAGDATARPALFATLADLQGLKGRPHFVARIALAAATTGEEGELARRFETRFADIRGIAP